MPNFDKTGPAGEGPGTGRGLGQCQGGNKSTPQGFRMRKGAGFCGRGFLKNSEVSLEDEEKFLENRLEAVRKLKADSK